MILVDYSSIIHRMVHASIQSMKPRQVQGKFVTSEYINFTKYLILQELFTIKQEHEKTYGDIVITLDNAKGGYWRKDFFPAYKSNRAKAKEETNVNFKEVFQELNGLMDQFRYNLPWKVIDVSKAEADDIMLVLARELSPSEKILIHSPDKDMIQAQRGTENVQQYSALTKKWIVPENKHETMDEWILEHVCLGDGADGVPRVIDHTEFSESFIEYLIANGCTIDNPYDFKHSDMSPDQKRNLLINFNVFKLNRKGESTGEKDVYKDIRFGPSSLRKRIDKFGSLDAWLDSHPLYREHYNRNFVLVMEEGIPSDIWNEIIVQYKEAKTDYNDKEFEEYLKNNELSSLLMSLPSIFKINRELTADDFGW